MTLRREQNRVAMTRREWHETPLLVALNRFGCEGRRVPRVIAMSLMAESPEKAAVALHRTKNFNR